MSKRTRKRATILRGAGRPVEHVLIETLTLRLIADESWQAAFSDEERAIWVDAAARYWRLQRKAGFDLTASYAIVLAMLQHASALLIERSETATKSAAIVSIGEHKFIVNQDAVTPVEITRYAE